MSELELYKNRNQQLKSLCFIFLTVEWLRAIPQLTTDFSGNFERFVMSLLISIALTIAVLLLTRNPAP
jgi:hypothetical protein